MNDRSKWFRRKRIGWGWSPQTWEGWAVTVASALVVAAVIPWLRRLVG